MAHEIERGIEIPKAGRMSPKYPLKEMAVGDSVWVPKENAGSFRTVVFNFSKKSGRKFITRSMARDGEPGVRAWRVE